MPRAQDADDTGAGLQARDIVAFGQEYGRVLSDGRVIGRAEPFAKVFPSSRAVKRAVGVTAWAILEDIALDAQIDVEGRLVSETNVRRIADNLRLATNTVAKHLARLREHGFVLHEEQRDDGSGRYVTSRYVLDPSACVERFTVTPPSPRRSAEGQASGRSPAPVGPRLNNCDTAPHRNGCDMDVPVSQPTRHRATQHRELRQNKKMVVVEEGPQPARHADELTDRLVGLGIDPDQAASLLDAHPTHRVRDAVDAVAVLDVRNPAGWVVAAIRGAWDVAEAADRTRQRRRADERRTEEAAREHLAQRRRQEHRRRSNGWADAVSAAFDDDQLTRAIEQFVPAVPGLGRRSTPMARSRLIAVAAVVHRDRAGISLGTALARALDADEPLESVADTELPEPPDVAAGVTPLEVRVAACLARLDAGHPPSHHQPATPGTGEGKSWRPVDALQSETKVSS